MAAVFPLEIRTSLVTGRTGSAFHPAQFNLVAGVRFFTMKPMNTEVFCIVKKAIMEMWIMNPVCFNFFRDCRRILAQEPGNLLKGTLLIERRFDIEPVIESQMFLVSGYKVTHRISFHCCQKEINRNITEGEQSMETRTPALTAGIYAMSDRRRRELKDIGKENLPIGLAIISRKYQLSRPSRCAVAES